MTYYKAQAGPGNVGSYQVSGIPYVTASLTVPPTGTAPMAVNFPSTTRFLTVTNTLPTASTNVPVRVGFSVHGVNAKENNNFFLLSNGSSYTGEWRVDRIFLLSDTLATETSASVIAGVTSIQVGSIPSNWSGSIGVG